MYIINKDIENKILYNKSQIDILFILYKVPHDNYIGILQNIISILDKSKYNIEILIICKSDFTMNLNVNTIILYESEALFWNSKASSNFNIKLNKSFDIIVSYLDIITADLISNMNIEAYKIAYLDQVFDISNQVYTQEYLVKIYNNMDEIICVSEYAKESIENLIGYSSKTKLSIFNKNMELNYKSNKVNLNKIINNKIFTIVSVGRLVWEKGYDRLIRIHKKLIDNGVENRLIIIGDGLQRNVLEELIEKLDVKDSCFLIGSVENPYSWIANCDLFVSSSVSEGLSLTIMECMILGKPIVATKTSGSEYLLKYKYGLIVNNEEDSLYDGIKTIIVNRDIREYYIKQLKECNEFKFEKSLVIKQIENLLDNGLSDRKINILFVMTNILLGGAEKSLSTILDNLDYSKYNVDLLLLSKDKSPFIEINENVNITYLYDHFIDVWNDYKLNKLNVYINNNYDVQIGYLGPITTDIIVNKGNLNSKKIGWIHGDFQYSVAGFDMNTIKSLYSKLDSIVCVSDGVEKTVIEYLGYELNLNTKVILNPMDTEYIIRLSQENIDETLLKL